jgi:hypothetical protein
MLALFVVMLREQGGGGDLTCKFMKKNKKKERG